MLVQWKLPLGQAAVPVGKEKVFIVSLGTNVFTAPRWTPDLHSRRQHKKC